MAGWQHSLLCRATARMLAALVLAVAPSPLLAQSPATGAPQSSFAWGDCPESVPPEIAHRVRCGTLTVPEDRTPGTSSQRVIRLPVAVLASQSATPAPDPVVFPTAGGPGAGSVWAVELLADWAGWATSERQLIVMEQRGDHASDPALTCPELDTAHFIEGGRLLAGSPSQARGLALLKNCRDRLAASGIDLTKYTSTNSAADLADLRKALGYDQWNLYGVSYGARLSLTMMRDRPEGLRAVVLDGPYPPNVNSLEAVPAGYLGAVKQLLANCAADATCAASYPHLERSLHELLDRAERAPFDVVVTGPGGESLRVTVNDKEISGGLFDALYDSTLIRVLPFVIDQLAKGNTDVALPLAQRSLGLRDRFTTGLMQSVECAEEVPFNDYGRRQKAGQADPLLAHLYTGDYAWRQCAVWQVPALGARENEAVRSDVPTLLASGAYDPVTPPAQARTAAQGLTRHYFVDAPTSGHGSVWQNWFDPCPAAVAATFLRDPTRAPDTSCTASTPPTAFLAGDDIMPTAAVYRLDSDVIQGRDPVQLALLSGTGVVFLLTLVLGSWTLIRRRVGKRSGDEKGKPAGVVLAMVASALNLAFAGAVALVLIRTDPLILGFGLPSAARPLAALPILAAASTIALAWFLGRSWLRGRTLRPALGTVTVASTLFLGWVLTRGLLVI